MTTYTITEGGVECGMCDSMNTIEARSDGEFSYEVLAGCFDCGFATVSRYNNGRSRTVDLAAHSYDGRCNFVEFFGCPDEAH